MKYLIPVTETKQKHLAGYPSAISSRAWREFHEIKDRLKQEKVEQVNKRKLERESKNVKESCKKKKLTKNNLKNESKKVNAKVQPVKPKVKCCLL